MSILLPYIIPRVEAKSRFVFTDFRVQISAQTMTILAKVFVTFLNSSTNTLGYYVIRQKTASSLILSNLLLTKNSTLSTLIARGGAAIKIYTCIRKMPTSNLDRISTILKDFPSFSQKFQPNSEIMSELGHEPFLSLRQ